MARLSLVQLDGLDCGVRPKKGSGPRDWAVQRPMPVALQERLSIGLCAIRRFTDSIGAGDLFGREQDLEHHFRLALMWMYRAIFRYGDC